MMAELLDRAELTVAEIEISAGDPIDVIVAQAPVLMPGPVQLPNGTL